MSITPSDSMSSPIRVVSLSAHRGMRIVCGKWYSLHNNLLLFEKVDLTSKSKVDSESKAVESRFSRNSPVVSESKVDSESKTVKSHFRVKTTFDSNFL